MLPTTTSKGRGAARTAPPLFGPYLRRIVKVGAGLPFVLLSSESTSFDRISSLWRCCCSGVRVSMAASRFSCCDLRPGATIASNPR
jgi:hypothetical protein